MWRRSPLLRDVQSALHLFTQYGNKALSPLDTGKTNPLKQPDGYIVYETTLLLVMQD